MSPRAFSQAPASTRPFSGWTRDLHFPGPSCWGFSHPGRPAREGGSHSRFQAQAGNDDLDGERSACTVPLLERREVAQRISSKWVSPAGAPVLPKSW